MFQDATFCYNVICYHFFFSSHQSLCETWIGLGCKMPHSGKFANTLFCSQTQNLYKMLSNSQLVLVDGLGNMPHPGESVSTLCCSCISHMHVRCCFCALSGNYTSLEFRQYCTLYQLVSLLNLPTSFPLHPHPPLDIKSWIHSKTDAGDIFPRSPGLILW